MDDAHKHFTTLVEGEANATCEVLAVQLAS